MADPDGAEEPGRGEMTVLEHLGELRAVILHSLAAIGCVTIAAWFVSDRAVNLLIRPAVEPAERLVFLSPAGAFLLRLKTALAIGLFVAAPFVIWRLWSFVGPGLLRKERRLVAPAVTASSALFYSGAAFAYLVILPISIRFLLGFGTERLQPMISGDHYFQFVLRLLLGFGLAFQFPVVVSVLAYWNVLDPDVLRRYWRHGVVLVFLFSALLTPPDVASQLLMAGPVLILYFLSIAVAKVITRGRRAGD